MMRFPLSSFPCVSRWLACVVFVASAFASRGAEEDGYRLWLRYDPIADQALRASYTAAITEIVIPDAPRPPWAAGSINAIRDELTKGLRGLLGGLLSGFSTTAAMPIDRYGLASSGSAFAVRATIGV